MKNLDATPLTFGKHTGKTPDEIADIDPGYIAWAYQTITPKICSKSLYLACVDELEEEQEDE